MNYDTVPTTAVWIPDLFGDPREALLLHQVPAILSQSSVFDVFDGEVFVMVRWTTQRDNDAWLCPVDEVESREEGSLRSASTFDTASPVVRYGWGVDAESLNEPDFCVLCMAFLRDTDGAGLCDHCAFLPIEERLRRAADLHESRTVDMEAANGCDCDTPDPDRHNDVCMACGGFLPGDPGTRYCCEGPCVHEAEITPDDFGLFDNEDGTWSILHAPHVTEAVDRLKAARS